MSLIDFADSQQIDAIFQEAVDKAMPLCVAVSFRAASFAIAKHKERGESIVIANKNEKVIIIAAEDIDRLKLQKIQKQAIQKNFN